jgi:hypothetical protein
METSGLDPEITICKIAVLPIKLCPPYYYIIYNNTMYYYIHLKLFKHFAIYELYL